MNPYINIALIVCTLLFALVMFWVTARLISSKDWVESAITGLLSFLSLLTALLAIGQYIN